MTFHTINLVVADVSADSESEFIRIIPTGAGISIHDDGVEFLTGVKMPWDKENPLYDASKNPPKGFRRILVNTEYQIYLFEAPTKPGSQEEWMREVLVEGAEAFIFVVQCLQPEAFPTVMECIRLFRSYAPIPFIVAANNFSLSDLSQERLQKELGLFSDTTVMPCSLSDPDSAQQVAYQAFKIAIEASS